MDTIDFTQALDRLAAATVDFAELADGVEDWAAPVSSCPGWSVRDLVIHLGGVHEWAASTIGADHAPADPPFTGQGLALGEWYRGQAARLLGTLRSAGPDGPAWTLWGDRVAAFWARRQLHETLIHGFDLSSSLPAGGPGTWSVDAETALDGLREVLSGFYPRQLRLGRTAGLPGAVRFEVTDDDGALLASLEAPAAAGEAGLLGTVTGTPQELYLALWGRADLPGATPELAGTIRAAKLVP